MNYDKSKLAPANDYSNACLKSEDTVAEEILRFAHELVEYADSVSGRLHNKLRPIMLDAPESGESLVSKSREYPPLFTELRGCFYQIRNRLDDISSALDRTTL